MSAKRAPAVDWTGKTLYGKWTVERLIGVGGTSTVLQARHRNGRRAALKILHQHLAAHGRTRERFLREGRLANLVNHPGVVAVLDDFMTDDGTAVLVLELVRGQTLASISKDSGGSLEAREVVAAACAVLEILAVAHDASVIHRDIKPENILRCEDGSYKLADFGLAALHDELGMLTGTNTALGTPAYMSPEQARGNALDVDARTDIWGLGATMFTLLTGRYLHGSSASRNLVFAAATEPVPPILTLEPALHPPLAAIVERSVKMDKEERWPNARAMLAELVALDVPHSVVRPTKPSDATDGGTLSTLPSLLRSWSRGRQDSARSVARVRRRIVAVGVLAASALALLAWWRQGSSRAGSDETAKEVPAALLPPPAEGPLVTRTPEHAVTPVPPEIVAKPRSVSAPLPRPPVFPPKQRNAPKPSATPPPSPPRALDVAAREAELAVPDDVLDRRE
jgi:serine/threonine protein kinase